MAAFEEVDVILGPTAPNLAWKIGAKTGDPIAEYLEDLYTITANLEVGEKVQLVGFGVFDIKERGSRIGRNPKTKEEIEIPATRVPVFKAGKVLKDAVSK